MGKLFIISAPSGTGKTTLAEKLLTELDNLEKVITYTTRKPRPYEKNGVDYVFITKEDFEKKIKDDFFLEYANVYGNYYGTPKKDIERILKEGKDALLVIDVQGAFKVKELMPDTITIFLLPPSLEELKRRIETRGYKDDNLERRLKTAKEEIPCAKYFDYIVVNDFLTSAVEKVKSIIVSHRVSKESILNNLHKFHLNHEVINLLRGGKCYVKET
ncbi:guanylate kinase [Aquifex sp.]